VPNIRPIKLHPERERAFENNQSGDGAMPAALRLR